MALELDTRQRAMLQEMGVQVWLPESGVAVLEREAAPAVVPARATATARPPAAAQAEAARGPQAVPAAPVAPMARTQPPSDASASQARPAAGPVGAPPVGADASTPDWSALSEAVGNCQACALCAGRSHPTLVQLPADAMRCDWMVLGDPPDEDEDLAGAPFAGQDGVLLANMLKALGLRQAHLPQSGAGASGTAASPAQRAYISNVLKCRPAHGAIPQAAELAACSAWLQREIALVQPKVILSLGRFANQVLLGETPALAALPLGKLRGTVHRYQGLAVVVSYPPKLLMRNSADKAKAWADLCLAAATLDTP